MPPPGGPAKHHTQQVVNMQSTTCSRRCMCATDWGQDPHAACRDNACSMGWCLGFKCPYMVLLSPMPPQARGPTSLSCLVCSRRSVRRQPRLCIESLRTHLARCQHLRCCCRCQVWHVQGGQQAALHQSVAAAPAGSAPAPLAAEPPSLGGWRLC